MTVVASVASGPSVHTLNQNLVICSISYEAQAAAAAAGQPAAALQLYPLPQSLVQQALQLGAGVSSEGFVHLVHNARWAAASRCGEWVQVWPASEEVRHLSQRPVDAEDALRLIARAHNERKEAIDGKAREALAELLASEGWSHHLDKTARAGRLIPEEIAQLDAHAATCKAREQAAEAERARLALERENAGQAQHEASVLAESRRVARLAAVVREVCAGSGSVLGRLDAPEGTPPLGLLPEDEALELVRLAKLPQDLAAGTAGDYVKLTSEDVLGEPAVEAGCDGDCRSASFSSGSPDDLTAEEWVDLQTIRVCLKAAKLPAGEIRLHTGTCQCRDVGDVVRRVGVKVQLDLGGLVVEREYGVL